MGVPVPRSDSYALALVTLSKLDVAIVGGGMAGSLLARQLARALPGRRIAVFDRKNEFSLNIGESMVEIASNYFVRRLGLGSYLYERHYPKNGLRFFFDTPDHDLPLHEMSEIGSESLPFVPAFQVDRSRLEADLVHMNREAGVDVRLGTKVEKLELGRDGQEHHIVASNGAGSEAFSCRWVVDASGRTRMLARQQGLHVPVDDLDNASVWGWFEGVGDVDALGPDSFRERVRWAPRRLSTLHFLSRGYWIWFIPLQNGLTSIGVVCDREHFDPEWRTTEGFAQFLHGHAAVSSLLQGAKAVDTQCFMHLAYGTRRFYSGDRWALVGESGAFPDPFYSPGADFIALANDFTADLIARDLGGEDREALCERVDLYDSFMQFRVEAAMRLYRDQYSVLGSYELCKLKWDFDVSSYYNLWVWPYLRDEHLNARKLKRQLIQKNHVLSALSNFASFFRRIDDHITRTGAYHRANAGQYSNGQDLLGFVRDVGQETSSKESLRRTEHIFNAVRNRGLGLLEDAGEEVAREPMPLAWFMAPRRLEDAGAGARAALEGGPR